MTDWRNHPAAQSQKDLLLGGRLEVQSHRSGDFDRFRVVEDGRFVVAEVTGCHAHPEHLRAVALLLEQVRAAYFPDATIAIQLPSSAPSAPATPAGGDPEPRGKR